MRRLLHLQRFFNRVIWRAVTIANSSDFDLITGQKMHRDTTALFTILRDIHYRRVFLIVRFVPGIGFFFISEAFFFHWYMFFWIRIYLPLNMSF
ncbi:hypothetical protein WB66_22820 [bacteria symbiont BFo1 of Frankliniella occidentalis]|nr:hypothetical protein WB66_22820 [bacteria symbiont BFo1 of Frankliniella occidentalis]